MRLSVEFTAHGVGSREPALVPPPAQMKSIYKIMEEGIKSK